MNKELHCRLTARRSLFWASGEQGDLSLWSLHVLVNVLLTVRRKQKANSFNNHIINLATGVDIIFLFFSSNLFNLFYKNTTEYKKDQQVKKKYYHTNIFNDCLINQNVFERHYPL